MVKTKKTVKLKREVDSLLKEHDLWVVAFLIERGDDEVLNVRYSSNKIHADVGVVDDALHELRMIGCLRVHEHEEGHDHDSGVYYPIATTWIFEKFIDRNSSSYMNGDFYETNKNTHYIWKALLRENIKQYIVNEIQNLFNSDHSFGAKSDALVDNLIKTMPASEVYTLLWSAGNNTLRYQRENHIGNKHAANIYISKADSFCDRVKTGEFNRYRGGWSNYPETILEQVFFTKFLNIGRDWIKQMPKTYRLKK